MNDGTRICSCDLKKGLCAIQFNNTTIGQALDQAMALLNKQERSTIFFINLDGLYKAHKDEEYSQVLASATLTLPDGIGLKLISRLSGIIMKDNCNGTDFSPRFMEMASAQGYRIFFLGGKEGVAEKAAEKISTRIKGIQIVGHHCGFFENDEEIIKKINSSRADILFVAMGVPAQEKWITRNRDSLDPKICLGVGALLDYLSERIPRAPKIFRRLHLEWFWRIFIEPRRMFKRYFIDGLGFLFYFIWLKIKQPHNKP